MQMNGVDLIEDFQPGQNGSQNQSQIMLRQQPTDEIINPNNNNNNLGPNSAKNAQKRQALLKYFKELSTTVDQLIDVFKLTEYEKYDPEKSREEYMHQLQNIIRNAGIHRSILRLLLNIQP